MNVSGIAGRYATALFELAQDQNALDQTAEDLASLGRMIAESADLERLVRSPVISRAAQAKAEKDRHPKGARKNAATIAGARKQGAGKQIGAKESATRTAGQSLERGYAKPCQSAGGCQGSGKGQAR